MEIAFQWLPCTAVKVTIKRVKQKRNQSKTELSLGYEIDSQSDGVVSQVVKGNEI